MNAKLSLNCLPLSPELWVSGCLIFFAKTRIRNPSTLLKDLLNELQQDQLLADYCQSLSKDPGEFIKTIDFELLDIPSSIKQWMSVDKVSREELFTLCFLAELDNNYNLNLLLQELQGPQQDNQLSMHFLCDLLTGLFNRETKPTGIQTWQSVKQGLLVIEKKGPLILSHIQLHIDLWQLCLSAALAIQQVKSICLQQTALQQIALQQTTPQLLPFENTIQGLATILIPAAGFSTAQQEVVDKLAIAIRLQHYSGVMLAADQQTAVRFAARLAQSLNITAVLPDAAWKSRFNQICLLAKIHDWLLVADENSWATELNGLQLNSQPCVLLYSSENSERFLDNQPNSHRKLFFYKPQENSFSDRFLSWQSVTSDQQAADFASRWLIDRSRIETLIRRIDRTSRSSENILEKISDARLAAAPSNLLDLAFHVSSPVNPDSVILQKRVENDLQSLFHRCLQREKIFSGLGGNLGQQTSAGVKALFSGESGTGKTLAATVLAHQLGIPLYRLDLGSILNKYVGETEKNIHKLLEQIASEDYILLIDEADALFGKRTDAESGGERFANMLTNYLLARIEQHQGIVLMTTNGLGRIDPAFMRRFDKVIEFLPPEFDERMAIWKSLLGERNPGDAYCRQLASLCELSGGFIRNAVLSAAAEVTYQQQKIIPYSNLLSCLAREYIKSGKPIPPKLTQLLSQQSSQQLAQQLSQQQGNKEDNFKESLI